MARVLLADDDGATRDLVSRALAADGHVVEAAADGQEALDIFLADPARFDLIIADVQMPLVDGIAVIEQARVAKPGITSILMSALTGELARAERLKLAGVRLVAKPVTLEKIRAEVKALLA